MPIELADIVLLFFVQFVFFDDEYVFVSQLAGNVPNGRLVLFDIFVVQLVDLFDESLRMFTFRAHSFVIAFGYTAKGGHTYTEEFIKVVRIDSKEA